MPNFSYVAKTLDGQTETGIAAAPDEFQLAQTLKTKGLILISAESQENKHKSLLNAQFSFGSGVSSTEKILLVRNMGVMFATGLSLVKSFDILHLQTKNKVLKSALASVKERIGKGENLSVALADYPKIFSELFVNMVKVGEESGTLEDIFQILSLQLSKEHDLKAKIKNAMVYPCMILMVMFVVGAVIITFVLPNLNIFFTSLNVDVPIYTKIMLASGNFLATHWYLLFVVPLLLVIMVWVALKTKSGKKAADVFFLRLPIIAPIVKKNNSAFLIRALSSLISAGVPLTRALEISGNAANNYFFKQAIKDAEQRIKKGEKLSSALKPYQSIFPLGVIEMVEVGEETGKTSVILKKLAEFYEQEAINAVEKLTVIIEPVLIIVLGVGVGFFAISIIQPMYSSLKGIVQ